MAVSGPTDAWARFPRALLGQAVALAAVRAGVADLTTAESPTEADVAAAHEPTVLAAYDAFDGALRDTSTFADLVRCCGLDAADALVLSLLLVVEVDTAARAQAVATGTAAVSGRATPALVEALLGAGAVTALAPGAPLLRSGLLVLDAGPVFGAAEILVARQVVWRLLGHPGPDPLLPSGARVQSVPEEFADGVPGVLAVHGADPTRRLQAAMRGTAGTRFLVTPPPADDAGWRAVVRQASLDGLGVVLTLAEDPTPACREWVERAGHLSWALVSRDPLARDLLPRVAVTEVGAEDPEIHDDEWAAVFPGWPVPRRRPTADQLRLVRDAAAPGEDPAVALRRLAGGTLLRHARRVTPRARWDDLVLPPAQADKLHGLVDRYGRRDLVHGQWGLPRYPSPGVVALFTGPSGTGKTTSAEVVAGELGVDLFRIDLSALVSKYIGETEKNLEEIFSAAHAGDYLLLFDEADSLFGSRSKVSDARDRYANMEVSYLLQRLETYDGLVVLTSNFQGNIDPAFLRRIHLTVHFPVPNAADRTRIWRRSLAAAPTDDLDLAFVAEKFDLSGGAIRNAALSAAFLAAAQERPVGMVHVLRAVSQELSKLGRRPTDDQFGRWLPQVNGGDRDLVRPHAPTR